MLRVAVNPELLRWARERSGLAQQDLAARSRLGKLPEWESGRTKPTLKQVEAFADAVRVPVGYLFLETPPEEEAPIPDFRTVGGQPMRRPGPDLLETIRICQERQGWYREYARAAGQPELAFVGSATVDMPPEAAAARMRNALDFDIRSRRACPTWTEALRLFVRCADEAGILVMVSGVVGSNNNRRLDPAEFRGFALADPLAPLVFVNGSDAKAAQMFTLAHELAHVWLGADALSNMDAAPATGFRREEVWCNAVAAELLVPGDALQAEMQAGEVTLETVQRLARIFKVSSPVVLRRLLDIGRLDRAAFDILWAGELQRFGDSPGSRGGNFYNTTFARVSRRFARALIANTLEGETLYRDAFRMLGVSGTETFNNLGRKVGILE
ncbi:MAG: ImmA/IrrE family metallo-endopeptidase [Alphaproteobacteria bacterium]|nr:ImmA/IrrE family metallo-endopeptidase [Alphaproteobacteria bacterium]